MENVLFGDVYLCGGQSNMQFSVPAITNSTEEIKRAAEYASIRLFTVGQKTSSKVPLDDLQTIEQNWSVASAKTVAGNGGFGYFSAVCWIFGREVFDALGGKVPVGLINNNWGGTPVPPGQRRPAHEQFSLFVCDLAFNIDDFTLQSIFASRFPSVFGSKVVYDTQTGTPKG